MADLVSKSDLTARAAVEQRREWLKGQPVPARYAHDLSKWQVFKAACDRAKKVSNG